jgi:hypothetical protein
MRGADEWDKSKMNPLHSIFIGLAALIVVALMVAIVSDGVLDHKSKHPLEARCQHHDGVLMQSATGSKTCLPKGMGGRTWEIERSG